MSLSLEQELNVRIFSQQTEALNREQLHALLVDTYRLKLDIETTYKEMLAAKWGI